MDPDLALYCLLDLQLYMQHAVPSFTTVEIGVSTLSLGLQNATSTTDLYSSIGC